MRIRKSLLALIAAGIVFGGGYSLLHAAFTPPPTVAPPPVIFSGTIEQAGLPIGGQHNVAFDLWRDPDTSVSANRVCQMPAQTLSLTSGLFELPLDAACVDALGRNNHVWYRLTVDGTAFPLVPIVAAPVALRSAREEQDGTRLGIRRRYRLSADGARIPGGVTVFDTQRNEDCNDIMTVEGGVSRTRCLPFNLLPESTLQLPPGAALYLDAGCTQSTSGRYAANVQQPTPPYYLSPGAVGGPDTAIYQLLGANSLQLYAQIPNPPQCLGPFQAFELLLGSQIPVTDFAELQEVVE